MIAKKSTDGYAFDLVETDPFFISLASLEFVFLPIYNSKGCWLEMHFFIRNLVCSI